VRLAEHVIARHYPDAAAAPHPVRALLEGVCRRQAALVARWMQVGFIHGVMNTDNMSVAGETIDYGPCAFLDAYDPATVFSSIDRNGRYAYANQPAIANWNLARLAECLLPQLASEETEAVEIAKEVLSGFADAFNAAYIGGFLGKIGLSGPQEDGDGALVLDLLQRMAEEGADFTLTFRGLGQAAENPQADASLRALFKDPTAYDGWAGRWRARLDQEPLAPGARRVAMNAVNPAVIPRNHHVEDALASAMAGDTGPFERLNAALAEPYADNADLTAYAALPPAREAAYRTFCGT
jgi:uncharacterized protein YdiU (UPF0061 family)